MIEEVEPRVVALLGTSWPLPYEVRIAEPSGDWNAETRTSDRRVTIRPGQLEAWRLAHELVHVHASGRWDGLPGVVEEGLAYLVGELAVGRKPEIVPPSPEALRLALTMSYGRWLTLDDERHHAVKNAAMWLALQLLPAAEVAFEPRELGDAGLRELHRATR